MVMRQIHNTELPKRTKMSYEEYLEHASETRIVEWVDGCGEKRCHTHKWRWLK
jgi:hypothetical protein